MYINRALEKQIVNASNEFACITIYGARQTGKLTMIKHLFSDSFNYVTFDDLSIRDYAIIDSRTVKDWLSVLETSGIIKLLQPYMANLSDRIIKKPKLYFLDTGLCAYLARIPTAEILEKAHFQVHFMKHMSFLKLLNHIITLRKIIKEKYIIIEIKNKKKLI